MSIDIPKIGRREFFAGVVATAFISAIVADKVYASQQPETKQQKSENIKPLESIVIRYHNRDSQNPDSPFNIDEVLIFSYAIRADGAASLYFENRSNRTLRILAIIDYHATIIIRPGEEDDVSLSKYEIPANSSETFPLANHLNDAGEKIHPETITLFNLDELNHYGITDDFDPLF